MYPVSQEQLVEHVQAQDFQLALELRITQAIVPTPLISLNRTDFSTEPSNIIRAKREKDRLINSASFADFVVLTDRTGQISGKGVNARELAVFNHHASSID